MSTMRGSSSVDDVGVGDLHNMDQLLDHLGTGRWTFFIFTVVATLYGCLAIPAMAGAFIAPRMDFTCRLPNYLTWTNLTQHSNSSTAYNSALTIMPIDECVYWVNSSDGSGWQESCTQWTFDHSVFGHTLTSEMSLVCGRSFLVPLYQSIYMAGTSVGSAVGGLLSDKIGRKLVYVWSTMIFVVMTAASAFLPNISLVMASRFILGIFHMASFLTGYTLVMETTRRVVRPAAGMMVLIPWALALMVYGGLGYVIKTWRHLQLATSLPFILLFPALWYLGESPRWLMVQGKVEAAQEEVNRVVRWHRVHPPPPNTLHNISQHLYRQQSSDDAARVKNESVYTLFYQRVLDLLVLFRTRRLLVLTLVVSLNFFTGALVYYGLSLSAVNFSADPYVYMTLSGLVELPCYTLTCPILMKLGRKKPAIVCFWVTGLCMVVLPFIPTETEWARMLPGLLGKMFINTVFTELYLYASELFPTEVRAQGLGTAGFIGRMGSLICPFTNDMLKKRKTCGEREEERQRERKQEEEKRQRKEKAKKDNTTQPKTGMSNPTTPAATFRTSRVATVIETCPITPGKTI